MDEVKVLRDDRRGGSTEVERERVFDGAQIMQLKDEVFREVLFIPPDHPTDTNVCCVDSGDGVDTRKEVTHQDQTCGRKC